MINDNILLVGCGKMGGALLGGLLAKGVSPDKIVVVEPNQQIAGQYGVKVIHDGASGLDGFVPDTVLLAVKPQIMADILPFFAKICPKNTLFLSIAAGQTLAFYEKHLGSDAAIVRAMPNLPALVGKGATVLCANKNINEEYKKRSEALFSTVGEVFWLEDESLMDAVTAISGSGPAYVFYFMESLLKAATQLGLPENLAKILAYSTMSGSAALAEQSDKSVKTLKEQVVSPKGTTEAGLNILAAEGAFEKLIFKTAEAACKRSKELAE